VERAKADTRKLSMSLWLALILQWLPVAVFSLLPVMGLVAGPAYAPLLFGMGGVCLILRIVSEGRFPPFDKALCALALALVILALAGTTWSIDPQETLKDALQMGGVYAGAISVLAVTPFRSETMERLFFYMRIAFVIGALIMAADVATGYPLMSRLVHSSGIAYAPTKYTRGVDYALLISWPLLFWLWNRKDWRGLISVALSVSTMVLLGSGTTAKVAIVLSALVLAMAWKFHRLITRSLIVVLSVWMVTLPVSLRALSTLRHLYPDLPIKASAVHRFEIWDYMTARVFERPLLGWGLGGAGKVPINPEELASYRFAVASGSYPHNQGLELWLETGVLGASIGLLFVLLVLVRIGRLPSTMVPFALGAFVTALCIPMTGIRITTDSWFAALAACGYLFMAAQRGDAGSGRGHEITSVK
jgi:O-antigen ligase